MKLTPSIIEIIAIKNLPIYSLASISVIVSAKPKIKVDTTK